MTVLEAANAINLFIPNHNRSAFCLESKEAGKSGDQQGIAGIFVRQPTGVINAQLTVVIVRGGDGGSSATWKFRESVKRNLWMLLLGRNRML
jgi:hypothetical protein